MSVESNPNNSPQHGPTQELDLSFWEEKYKTPDYANLNDDIFHLLMNSSDSQEGGSLFSDPMFEFCFQDMINPDALGCQDVTNPDVVNVQDVKFLDENSALRCQDDEFPEDNSHGCQDDKFPDDINSDDIRVQDGKCPETDENLHYCINYGMQEYESSIQSAEDFYSWTRSQLKQTNNDDVSESGQHTTTELDPELVNRFPEDFWKESCGNQTESKMVNQSNDRRPINDNEVNCEIMMCDDEYIENDIDIIELDKQILFPSVDVTQGESKKGNHNSEDVRIHRDLSEGKLYGNVVDDFANKLHEECIRENNIWSILTDTLCYIDGHNELKDNSKRSQHLNSKNQYFLADNNNIPAFRRKVQKAVLKANRYIPNNNDRYRDVKSVVKPTTVLKHRYYEPNKDISSTYLYTQGVQSQENVNFLNTQIPMTMNSTLTGKLSDGTKLRILVDSGCSKSMMNQDFYERHPVLHDCPIYDMKPREIKVANNAVITVNKCIHTVLQIENQVLEIIAYLSPMLKDYDFILGQKTMYELEASPNFGSLTFDFKKRSIPLQTVETITVKPHSQKEIWLKMTWSPKDFEHAQEAIVKLAHKSMTLPQTMKVSVLNKTVKIIMVNNDNKEWFIPAKTMLGSIDMRSVGYFHITRDTLQRVMNDKCAFLSDMETMEYFMHLIQDTREIIDQAKKMNTRLKDSKIDLTTTEEKVVQKNKLNKADPWPWLEKDDPRRNMTDEEILRKYINLEGACITERQKEQFYKVALKYKSAFSLRDEIGTCPHLEIELELTDKTPFFIRPFPIKETDKAIVDKEMRKGVLLGILRKGMSSYSSPIMLIPRKLTGIPRIVTDFRHLNSRLVTINPSIPLVRDAIQMIGASGCEQLSVVDLRDAYHTLRLSKKSQQFCGITPYYGSDTYLYQRLGMGLSVSPAIWQNFINKVLNEIPERQHHLAIMDDCLVHSKKKDHLKHLAALFKALQNNGLKISPKKCQLFREELVYMGHKMMIKNGVPCITPLKNRIEAIIKLGPLKTPKNCKQFCGMVNYMSMFLPELQKDLIPIYALTKKGMPWHWGKEEQNAYDVIKHKATSPPVLVMPTPYGYFILASDTSKIACGSALYQEQKKKYRLIAYYSKKLPDACSRYSISELELTGLTCNISAFKHLLRHVNFTVYVDHSALVNILKAKKEPPTLRLQKLIEKLSEYSFNIKYMKGKDMYIADFLSRHPDGDTGPLNEIIPIAFLLQDNEQFLPKYNATANRSWQYSQSDKNKVDTKKKESTFLPFNGDTSSQKCSEQAPRILPLTTALQTQNESLRNKDNCYIMTRSQAKVDKVEIPNIYPLKGETKQPEVQNKIADKTEMNKVGEAQVQPDPIVVNESKESENEMTGRINKVLDRTGRMPLTLGGIAPHSLVRPHGRPRVNYEGIVKPIPLDIKIKGQLPRYDTNREFSFPDLIPKEEEMKKRTKKLFEYLNNADIVSKHIPKQVKLDKFLHSLKERVIHDYELPLTLKEMKAEYPNSPFFADIYKYLTKDTCRFKGKAEQVFKSQCSQYLLIKGLLFKLVYPGWDKTMKPHLVLCVPEKLIPTILHQYHDSILSGHPGVTCLYNKLRKKYFFPGMHDLCRQYVITCFNCESRKRKLPGMKIHYPRIPLDYKPLSRLSLDLKSMPYSKMGYDQILVCTCEVTNYVMAFPIPNGRSETIAEVIFNRIVCVFGTPKVIISDEGSALTSELMKQYYHTLNIECITISPFNHGSNRTERYIKTLAQILCKCLESAGQNWPKFVFPATFALNTQVSAVTGYSPYEMLFLTSPPDPCKFDFDPETTGIKAPTEIYMKYMKNKYDMMKSIVLYKKSVEANTQYIREMRKHPDEKLFAVGDLVYLNFQEGSKLDMPSTKFTQQWVGPLKVQVVLDDTHYLISDWEGRLVPLRVHLNRLKPYHLNLGRIQHGKLEIASNLKQLQEKWEEIKQKVKED